MTRHTRPGSRRALRSSACRATRASSAGFRPLTWRASTACRRASCSRRSTKASAFRCSRRWRAAFPLHARAAARSPRSRATRPSFSTPSGPRRSRRRSRRCWSTRRWPNSCERPGWSEHASSTGTRPLARPPASTSVRSPHNRLVPPRITIVTPSLNQAAFLERTIRSVLDQDYPELEYLVFDGGSTDGSVEILRRYGDRIAYWESVPDRGQSHAVNKGFERAMGEIVGWINSDDYYLPGALATA